MYLMYRNVADALKDKARFRDKYGSRVKGVFVVLSFPPPGNYILINAEVDTRAEALDYQQHAEYELGEVAWIEVR